MSKTWNLKIIPLKIEDYVKKKSGYLYGNFGTKSHLSSSICTEKIVKNWVILNDLFEYKSVKSIGHWIIS